MQVHMHVHVKMYVCVFAYFSVFILCCTSIFQGLRGGVTSSHSLYVSCEGA